MRSGLCKPRALFKSLMFEHLEDRAMMAGNVTAALCNGNLVICGDKCDNQICVTQCDGKFIIKGLCDTTINGRDCAIFCDPVCSVKIDLKCGCDTVKVSEICIRGCLAICGQDGNENICVTNSTLGGLGINGGNGCDDVRLSCLRIICDAKTDGKKDSNGTTCGSVCIDTGKGNDCVLICDVCAPCCKLQVKLGDGRDVCLVSKSDFKQICVDSGKGCDIVAINRCHTSDSCEVKCSDKKSSVCLENNNCRTQKCNVPCKAELADCVHEVTKCRDWCDWDCQEAELV